MVEGLYYSYRAMYRMSPMQRRTDWLCYAIVFLWMHFRAIESVRGWRKVGNECCQYSYVRHLNFVASRWSMFRVNCVLLSVRLYSNEGLCTYWWLRCVALRVVTRDQMWHGYWTAVMGWAKITCKERWAGERDWRQNCQFTWSSLQYVWLHVRILEFKNLAVKIK
jgi:hypothetical protein